MFQALAGEVRPTRLVVLTHDGKLSMGKREKFLGVPVGLYRKKNSLVESHGKVQGYSPTSF